MTIEVGAAGSTLSAAVPPTECADQKADLPVAVTDVELLEERILGSCDVRALLEKLRTQRPGTKDFGNERSLVRVAWKVRSTIDGCGKAIDGGANTDRIRSSTIGSCRGMPASPAHTVAGQVGMGGFPTSGASAISGSGSM